MLEVFHQLGFRSSWNLESYEKAVGDGLILSPKHMERSKVEKLRQEIKERSIFDPQFFNPGFCKGKLSYYDFHPNIVSKGFITDEYTPQLALQSARGCVKFQNDNNFHSLVIPTRYVAGMPSTYISEVQTLFVDPFFQSISEYGCTKRVLLQLILTDYMIKDIEYSKELLNWITGLDGIDGVYIITEIENRNKQIEDYKFLVSFLSFIRSLKNNDLYVVLGYLNTESILYSIAEPDIVTVGSYENTRIFNFENFCKGEDDPYISPPSARLYVTKLLQNIDNPYIDVIANELQEGYEFFDQNEYQAVTFKPTYNWHFHKAEPYKHLLLELTRQIQSVEGVSGKERYLAVVDMIESALGMWKVLIDQKGLSFESESDGSHLHLWLNAAHAFARTQGWR